MASFDTAPDSHYHGIAPHILMHVLGSIEHGRSNVDYKVGALDAPFAIATVTLDSAFGKLPCDLRGPIVGDAPIGEDSVTYANRPGVSYRTWESRLCDLPPLDSDLVTVIASNDGIISVFVGPLATQEVGDPGAFDADASEKFWSEHALSTESLTREGWAG